MHLEFPIQCHRVLICCCCREEDRWSWIDLQREREREVLKVNDSNRMKIVMCVHVLVKCISEISIHIPICVELYRGMHCITIQWCLKIWQSKIVTWFSTNNNDMRSTQNNFFFFSFLVLGYWFSLTQFPSIPPIFLPRLFPVRAFQEKVEVAL